MGFLEALLASLAFSLLFLELRMPLASAIIMIAFALHSLFFAGEKTVRTAKKLSKSLSSGARQELEETHGSHPPMQVWQESMQELGKKAGEQAFAPDTHKFSMPKWGNKLSQAVKRLIHSFKKLFGE